MRERRRGFFALIGWGALLVVLTFAIQLTYALWPWQATQGGTDPLRDIALAERSRVEQLGGGASVAVIGAAIDWTYRFTFQWTGLASAREPASDDAPQTAIGQRLVQASTRFIDAFYWSVQLIGLRIGVLLASLPLFLVVGLAGAVDGAAAWYTRRTAGGRESGFIYHRAKFALWAALFVLWAVYLLPPTVLDPKIIIPPFIVFFGVTVRTAVSWFKKYV